VLQHLTEGGSERIWWSETSLSWSVQFKR